MTKNVTKPFEKRGKFDEKLFSNYYQEKKLVQVQHWASEKRVFGLKKRRKTGVMRENVGIWAESRRKAGIWA